VIPGKLEQAAGNNHDPLPIENFFTKLLHGAIAQPLWKCHGAGFGADPYKSILLFAKKSGRNSDVPANDIEIALQDLILEAAPLRDEDKK
jgi:hypothetical protein